MNFSKVVGRVRGNIYIKSCFIPISVFPISGPHRCFALAWKRKARLKFSRALVSVGQVVIEAVSGFDWAVVDSDSGVAAVGSDSREYSIPARPWGLA